jgi:heme A synthase
VWVCSLLQTLFSVTLVTYLLLILMETLFEGSVSSYLNLEYMLVVVIIIGIAASLTVSTKEKGSQARKPTLKNLLMIICAGVGGAVMVWYKIREIGWPAYVVSVVSGALIVILSIVIWQGDKEEDHDGESIQGS